MTEITRKRDGAKLRIRFNAETDEMCRRYLGARIRSAFFANGGKEARPYSSLNPYGPLKGGDGVTLGYFARFLANQPDVNWHGDLKAWSPARWREAFAGFVR